MTSIDEISIEELYFKKGKESADDFKKTYIPSYRGKKPILILIIIKLTVIMKTKN